MRNHVDTQLIHLPDVAKEAALLGSLTPPLFQTSAFVFDSAEQGGHRFAGEENGYMYSRMGNPTTNLLGEAVAELEGAEAGLTFASGMAAISAVVLALLKSGDHVLTTGGIYGCTFGLLSMLREKFGIQVTHADLSDEASVREAMHDNTTLVYVETPANPTMRLADIAATARVAKEHGATVVVDNTFATPLLQRPVLLGADVVVHSATKYLGGHGDVILGVAAGSKEFMERVARTTLKDIGGIAPPFDAWLVLRGLKTLSLRIQRHVQSASALAARLSDHSQVKAVYFPGMDSSQRDLYTRQMKGPGGMISFELMGGFDAGLRFMNSLKLCKRAVSLGDTHTLVQHPASMTHALVPAEVREQMGISDGLIRMSVGLEDLEDIWTDLKQALN